MKELNKPIILGSLDRSLASFPHILSDSCVLSIDLLKNDIFGMCFSLLLSAVESMITVISTDCDGSRLVRRLLLNGLDFERYIIRQGFIHLYMECAKENL